MSTQYERAESAHGKVAGSPGLVALVALRKRRLVSRALRSRPAVLAVLIVVLSGWMSVRYNGSFATSGNIKGILLNASTEAILAAGMMLLLISGIFDLSIGGTLGLCGVVAATAITKYGIPAWAGVGIGLAAGVLAGALNGVMVTVLRVNALITTLATLLIFRGLTQAVAGGGVTPIGHGFPIIGQKQIFGLGLPFWIMLVIVTLLGLCVRNIRYFRQFYFVGGNARAAELSGIRVNRILLCGFILMGILAAVAGMLNAARFDSADVSAGTGIELEVITACVLGGASLRGGEGSVLGALLGVLFIALLDNVLVIINVAVYWQGVVIGAALLIAMSLDRFAHSQE